MKKQFSTKLAHHYRDLLKHSAIYGLGQVLTRLASFLLLPLYTNYLQPADYGIIAVLDLCAGLLGVLIGSGMVAAVNRHHFEAKDEAERNQVWWTGFTLVIFTATVITMIIWLSRHALADLALGSSIPQGAFYFSLIVPTLWLGTVGPLALAYLRIRKWSGIYISIMLTHLLLSIGLNVYFLTALHLGVTGILLGNLITHVVTTLAVLIIFAYNLRSYAFHWPLAQKLWKFGSPLIVTGLLSVIMQQGDRYLLRLFLDMEQVGIYSLAHTIGMAINTLCLLPFSMIWSVVVYEIAQQPDAKQVYVTVFQYFVYGLALVMLGVSLFARPLLALMAAPDFLPAADLIPIVCLAYLFFSLHTHFTVPVLLAKRTETLLLASVIAVLTNFAINMLLIPRFGLAGAAWTSVITFATFSFVGLWRYRRIDRYDYPFLKCGLALTGMVVSYGVYQALLPFLPANAVWSYGIAAGIWIGWGMIFFGSFIWRFVCNRKPDDFVIRPDHEKA